MSPFFICFANFRRWVSVSFIVRVDNYDLDKTLKSGQMFRYKEDESGIFRVISRDKICFVKQTETGIVVKTPETKEKVLGPDDVYWRNYFGFGRSYAKLEELSRGNAFLEEVIKYNQGLRILKQDSWECLISFIISQQKRIPQIQQSIEKLCAATGKELIGGIFAFPTAEELLSLSIDRVGLGYRKGYVLGAAYLVREGILNLNSITADKVSYKTAMQQLYTVRGVGPKVANCIALFGLGFMEAFPVDTHISKILALPEMTNFNAKAYGDLAGVMQQYLFNYAINHGI